MGVAEGARVSTGIVGVGVEVGLFVGANEGADVTVADGVGVGNVAVGFGKLAVVAVAVGALKIEGVFVGAICVIAGGDNAEIASQATPVQTNSQMASPSIKIPNRPARS